MAFIKRMPIPVKTGGDVAPNVPSTSFTLQSHSGPYSFEPYSEECSSGPTLEKDRKSNGSFSAESSEGEGTQP